MYSVIQWSYKYNNLLPVSFTIINNKLKVYSINLETPTFDKHAYKKINCAGKNGRLPVPQ